MELENLSSLNFQTTSCQRVLRVKWNLRDDEFGFDVSLPQKTLTRRGIPSSVSSLFEPLGFVAPVILEPKPLLQNLCKRGCKWDELIDADEAQKWKLWLEALADLSKLRIRRCFKPKNFGAVKHYQIHVFSDASLQCYGSCCYLRMVNYQEEIHVAFALGKLRVAPIKSVSVSRLELTAAVVSVRLEQFVKRELNLPNCKSMF